MRILITGAAGQLGTALQHVLAHHDLTPVDLPAIDVADGDSVRAAVARVAPELVIHCAAYTDVDGCARDPERAFRVNTHGAHNVALACLESGAALVHISTNEVFAGDEPGGYEEWMPLAPRNPYGRSKAAAEVAVSALLSRAYIIRTAWLYAPGGRNFIHAILKRARETGTIRVVTDEVGNPTYAPDLAAAIGHLVETEQYGVYHFTNSGACSRWAFANEILRQAGIDAANVPILSGAYPRVSSPPPFAALHNRNGAALGITLRPWQEALADYLHNEPLP